MENSNNLQDLERYERYKVKLKLLGMKSNMFFDVTNNGEVVLDCLDSNEIIEKIVIPDFVTFNPKVTESDDYDSKEDKYLDDDQDAIFQNNYRLKEIYVENKPDTPLDCSYVFRCIRSDYLKIRFRHPECVVNTSYMFQFSDFKVLDIQPELMENVYNAEGMFLQCGELTTIKMERPWKAKELNSAKDMFYDCYDLEYVDMSAWICKPRRMDSMFLQCRRLKKVDLGQIDLSRMESMEKMFYGCESLEEVVSQKLVGSDCSRLRQLGGMFIGCSSLKHIDLQRINVKNVVIFSGCFSGCKSLESVNLDNWRFDSCRQIDSMFLNCGSLRKIDTSTWDLSKVRYMRYTFAKCYELTELDQTSWGLDMVESMNQCFFCCTNLRVLDVSKWRLRPKIDVGRMLDGCEQLSNEHIEWYDNFTEQ